MKLNWRKSSYSGGEGNCVELATLPDGGHAVRDSKNKDGPVLQFSRDAWRTFVADVKTGKHEI